LSQCSDLRIWPGLEDLEAAITAQARTFWYAEDDLTVFEEGSGTLNYSSQVFRIAV